jgi:hypothetical protein
MRTVVVTVVLRCFRTTIGEQPNTIFLHQNPTCGMAGNIRPIGSKNMAYAYVQKRLSRMVDHDFHDENGIISECE